MSRALLVVLDSLGVGALPDAVGYGGIGFTDAGADTLGHIAAWCARPVAEGGRGRPLAVPHLVALGLGQAAALARGVDGAPPPGLEGAPCAEASWGCARERSRGKDTVSGHWELCGLPVAQDWGYFSAATDSLPAELVAAIARDAGTPGVLGNRHASGTVILDELGAEHLRTGWPIVYTSADSVVQIAAHEEAFGLERLYALCEATRARVDAWRIGRVIARPFLGDAATGFARTPNRRDWAVPPPAPTLLDALREAGGEVIAIGKIHDIFAGRGVTRAIKAHGLDALVAATREAFAAAPPRSLVFTNLVDFDQAYGHRRDVAGYAAELERFDALLPGLQALLGPGDLLVLVADHGNDPTWPGSDHTREHIPVLASGGCVCDHLQPGRAPAAAAHRGGPLRGGSIGVRASFADVGQTLARHLGLPPLDHGLAFD